MKIKTKVSFARFALFSVKLCLTRSNDFSLLKILGLFWEVPLLSRKRPLIRGNKQAYLFLDIHAYYLHLEVYNIIINH